MALRFPLFPIAASPSLGAALMKIARTPAARLSINFRLTGQQIVFLPGERPTEFGLLSHRELRARDAQLCDTARREHQTCVWPPKRSLGQALYVDRLVAGTILGTTLDILQRETEYVYGDPPTIGKNFDVAT